MKAIVHIIAVLMTIHFGALEAIAQSARRSANDNRENKVNTERRTRSVHTVSPERSSKQTKSSISRKPEKDLSNSRSIRKHSLDKQENSSARSRSIQRKSSADDRDRKVRVSSSRKTSTTNRHNPRSNYRAPERKANLGKTYRDPKSSARHVQSNKQLSKRSAYHPRKDQRYYYPNKKVRIHVHPRTYHNHYRVLYYPAHREIVWTRRMYRDYSVLYPGFRWRYPIGYKIHTISAFEARYNAGEVSRVYGRVYGTWYNRETDDLLLFFGGEYPHQVFTMVVPGKIARRYNWRPERYFLGQHVLATGLITNFEGNPEMIIKKHYQLDVY